METRATATLTLMRSDWEVVCSCWDVWTHGRFSMGLPDLQRDLESAMQQAIPAIRRACSSRHDQDMVAIKGSREGWDKALRLVDQVCRRGKDHPYLVGLHAKMREQFEA